MRSYEYVCHQSSPSYCVCRAFSALVAARLFKYVPLACCVLRVAEEPKSSARLCVNVVHIASRFRATTSNLRPPLFTSAHTNTAQTPPMSSFDSIEVLRWQQTCTIQFVCIIIWGVFWVQHCTALVRIHATSYSLVECSPSAWNKELESVYIRNAIIELGARNFEGFLQFLGQTSQLLNAILESVRAQIEEGHTQSRSKMYVVASFAKFYLHL